MAARGWRAGVWIGLLTCAGLGGGQATAPPGGGAIPTFGTTVVDSAGLTGQIYFLPEDTAELPNFKRLRPVGSIYTTQLNIPPSRFESGFPGVTNRFEWFAIDYTGRFWITDPGVYHFALVSDDGAKLYLDGRVVVNNDGQHPPQSCGGSIELETGVHALRLSYFQGPRSMLALMLGVQPPGGRWQVFDTRNFAPPADTNGAADDEHARKRSGKIKRGDCWTG